MTPTIAARSPIEGSSVRFVRVDGDHMEPTLRSGDYVAASPTSRFHYDSLYLIDSLGFPVVYRCQHIGRGTVRISHDRRPGDPQHVTMEWFESHVLGIVAATCRVLDHGLLEGSA